MKQISFGCLWCVLLLISGCSPTPDEQGNHTGKTADNSAISETRLDANLLATTNASTRDTVVIQGMKYTPEVIEVNKGDTVVFINRDIVVHDVTEENKVWGSSEIPVGKSWSLAATESVNYFCSIHVVMKGKVVVK